MHVRTGHIVFLEQSTSTVVWSAKPNKPIEQISTPILQLLDTGNLVLRDGKDDENSEESYLWQSFDCPTDTLLPGMKLGWDLRTGFERRIVSWKSSDDPYPGDFSWGIALCNYPESMMWVGSEKYCRNGPWNGIRFSGSPELKPENPLFSYEFVSSKYEVYYIFHLRNESEKSRVVVNQSNGNVRNRFFWNSEARRWDVFTTVPRDNCDRYGLCGPYGNCIIGESPACQCLKGFKPKGNLMEWSQGCVRNKQFSCQDKDSSGFVRFKGLKLPDATYTWVNASLNLKECRAKCLSNCSCTAYTNSDIKGGSGCVMWFGDLIDIRQFQDGGGQDLHVRMHASEIGGNSERMVEKVVVVIVVVLIILCGLVLLAHRIRKVKTRKGLEEGKILIIKDPCKTVSIILNYM
ncbi:hypothetical protein FEM48_Zijuj01G0215500 [Ziziphus jujuba var. spinosa]|uniref:Uncharacterized protein n=1 Tax=Ziziphus jujuba var. spinosa TaxID=714518 RepID=A0A978W3P2_ZIZJJ|nr:hypothetical protein FEM48_Zijuj01G0215500 [Ziziphus jujuba var. spinosa]